MSTEEMFNRLRSNAGHWHQLAKLLPLLQRAGVDSVQVEEAVGLERKLQNMWTAAEQVGGQAGGRAAGTWAASLRALGGCVPWSLV